MENIFATVKCSLGKRTGIVGWSVRVEEHENGMVVVENVHKGVGLYVKISHRNFGLSA